MTRLPKNANSRSSESPNKELTNDAMIDRNAYIKYLEDKLENVTSANLELNCFGDRLRHVENQLMNIENRVPQTRSGSIGTSKCTPSLSEIDIMKNRIMILEERLNRHCEPVEKLITRVHEVEAACNKLADDSLAAVQDMHIHVSKMESDINQKIDKMDSELSLKLTESIEQISAVLSRLIAYQKSQSRPLASRQTAMNDLVREIQYLEKRNASK